MQDNFHENFLSCAFVCKLMLSISPGAPGDQLIQLKLITFIKYEEIDFYDNIFAEYKASLMGSNRLI